MSHRSLGILAAGVCPLLLSLTAASAGAVADANRLGPVAGGSSWGCLPRYGEPKFLLRGNATHPNGYEANPHAVDLNGDGLEDIVIDRVNFQTYETFELDVLLNDGSGGLELAASSIFAGAVPAVQNVAWVLLEDFNGDGTLRNESATRLEPLDRQIWIRPLILRDLDRDGDQDLLARQWDWQDADPPLFLNDGRGRFWLEPLESGLGWLYFALLDLDGDGGHDSGCLVYVPLVQCNWPASRRQASFGYAKRDNRTWRL